MLDQNIKSETSINTKDADRFVIETTEFNRLTAEGLKFSLELYRKTLERNQALENKTAMLQARLDAAKPNIVGLIVSLSWVAALWNIATQIINK